MRILLVLLFVYPIFAFAQNINKTFLINGNINYIYVKEANEGMFGFIQHGKYGYIDKNGKVLIPAEYELPIAGIYNSIPSFYQGKAVYKKENKWYIMDKTGKKLIPGFECEKIVDYDLKANVFVLNKLIYGQPKAGMVNSAGQEIIPFKYKRVTIDSNLVITTEKNLVTDLDMYTLFDIKGKEILKGDGVLDNYYLIKIFRSEKKILVHDLSFNYVYDLNMKLLLQLPRTVEIKSQDDKAKLESNYGKAATYFTKAAIGEIRDMYIDIISKDRLFFYNKYLGYPGKVGLLDLKGNVLVDPKYDFTGTYFDKYNMCRVSIKQPGSLDFLDSYIDLNGKELFTLADDNPSFYPDAQFGFKKDKSTNLWGTVDRKGKWVIQPSFTTAGYMDKFGGFWAVPQYYIGWSYFDFAGNKYGQVAAGAEKYTVDDQGYFVATVPDTNYRTADEFGNIFSPIPDLADAGSFNEGLAPIKNKSAQKFGFIDSTGKHVIPCQFDEVSPFKNGMARVGKVIGGKLLGGYIDKTGKTILPLEYERLGVFSDGFGLIKTAEGYFYIDKTGKKIPPPDAKWNVVSEFNDGLAFGTTYTQENMNYTREYQYFNNKFEKQFSIVAYEATNFWGNFAIARLDPGNYCVIDRKGKKVKDLPVYEGMNNFGDGMFAAKLRGKWGYLNEKGEPVTAMIYDSVSTFIDGFARVKQNGKWGLINRKGAVVIECKNEQLLLGSGGIVSYKNNYRTWGVKWFWGGEIFPNQLARASAFMEGKGIIRFEKQPIIMRSPLAK